MNIYDVTIKNGYIADPERMTVEKGNIGINSGRICTVTDTPISGRITIDASGRIVSPGFIDIHAHINGDAVCGKLSLAQGITTTIGGNCGGGILDVENFFSRQDSGGFPINQAQFVGHSFLLRNEAGACDPYVPATKRQIKTMKKLLRQSFREGAIGVSFGLEYAPGSSFEEVIELSRIAAEYGRLVSIHTRLSGPGELESLKEAIDISEITGARVQISHLVYQYGTGIMAPALEMIESARKSGFDVWADSGMYTNFATGMNTSVYDPDHIKKFGWKYGSMLVASGKYKGQYLTESLYHELRKSLEDIIVICFTGVEEEIYDALNADFVVPSSDAGPSPSGNIKEGHPQNSGTFPRFFREMVHNKNRLSIIDAVRKSSLLPAEILGFENKGRIREGADADLVVFNPDTICDNSDFEIPDRQPSGIDYVIVNGKISVKNGHVLDNALSGRSIKYPGAI
ncbi:MAG: amidohydrolase family protein [Clostridium sp.]|jgi:N-acyl-D-amino-acid deacylase|uniref:N-acyl-D-amino-acid deacylase family protein n=1 Tax=Clostridium sp. TaxID=1506 RepID=UPI0025BF5F24|nr:amidohydrolase family protein [Clostridium sp.]MCH3965066.1 amidohydrolase family protein [Clostridium sp.]MCI1714287.1 amidohydrolase family protein [Clostridium sp.]MCI1798549.1 amidohydrolase family protein [Clostridium sp.]MCI1812720.1 amidohydrolase family protein [Clostridium sp.]MCI1869358.1 amidohydrolase family protein [Clostridium sp.]